MTVAEIVAEFMDRMICLAEEDVRMTTRLQLLFETVKTAERERAEYGERWDYTPEYDAHLDTEEINALFGWARDKTAREITERRKAEWNELKSACKAVGMNDAELLERYQVSKPTEITFRVRDDMIAFRASYRG